MTSRSALCRPALIAAAVSAAALVAAAPAPAQDEHPADGTRHVERVIVMSDGSHRSDGDRTSRRIQILNLGDGADCDKTEVNDDNGAERTKIVVCTRGGDKLASADRAEKLERALSRIQQNDELSAEHKERVTAALREAIERLRATR